MMAQTEGDPVWEFSANDLRNNMFWELPPSDPSFYWDINRLASIIQFKAQPGSFFRNTNGNPSGGLGLAVLPTNEGDISGMSGFAREDNNSIDRLVYQGDYDFNLTGPVKSATNILTTCRFSRPSGGHRVGESEFRVDRRVEQSTVGVHDEQRRIQTCAWKHHEISARRAGKARDVPGWHETIVSDRIREIPDQPATEYHFHLAQSRLQQ